ncbi:hypothetical protein L211DRAFT_852760 [Terfezia boudieri ATCC MYA-4762]|uniref:Uncharacterized protein n=1 Tax=Terfezia boudieri ATCC MYA-4762 TaxID=1051890 RepID=A0A3N4LER8_9PEZI|nr:hypothetical protein L211DRAFT_852760 [Terfezia boudieri ATCC MYA-4762]
MVMILSDSQAAAQTVSNLSKGAPPTPRSGIEAEIKRTLVNSTDFKDVRISWGRGHIGIKGIEKAEPEAIFESCLGNLTGTGQDAHLRMEGAWRVLGLGTRRLEMSQGLLNFFAATEVPRSHRKLFTESLETSRLVPRPRGYAPLPIRKEARTKAGFGIRKCEWGRQALSAYNWLRTD